MLSSIPVVSAGVGLIMLTDNDSYFQGDTITITAIGGAPAGVYMLQITDSSGSPIWTVQDVNGLSGDMMYTVVVSALWDYGTYTVYLKDMESGLVAEKDITLEYDPSHLMTLNYDLNTGWNLISFPLSNMTDSNVTTLFDEVSFYQIAEWTDSGYNTTETVESGKGYWVFVNEPSEVSVEGYPLPLVTLNLTTGWDLCGGPITREDSVPVFDGFYQVVGWDGFAYQPKNKFQPQRGYWVLVLDDQLISIPTV